MGENRHTADLGDLLARVEAAGGPDREIDCALACALDGIFPDLIPWQPVPFDRMIGPKGPATWRVEFCRQRPGGLAPIAYGGTIAVRAYTASLDAALALVERVLPGCDWIAGPKYAHIDLDAGPTWWADGATPALALLAALLRAAIAKASGPTPTDGEGGGDR